MAHITVTDGDFDAKVVQSKKPILVDFWAPWCGPCKMQNPILDELEKELGDTADIAKLNVDENPQTAQKFGVMSIPTLMVFKDGKHIKQYTGLQSKETLKEVLEGAAN